MTGSPADIPSNAAIPSPSLLLGNAKQSDIHSKSLTSVRKPVRITRLETPCSTANFLSCSSIFPFPTIAYLASGTSAKASIITLWFLLSLSSPIEMTTKSDNPRPSSSLFSWRTAMLKRCLYPPRLSENCF